MARMSFCHRNCSFSWSSKLANEIGNWSFIFFLLGELIFLRCYNLFKSKKWIAYLKSLFLADDTKKRVFI